MSRERELIDESIQVLSEWFDTVQVLATRYDPETGCTTTFDRGRGNIYARVCHAREFVERDRVITEENEKERLRRIKDNEDDPP